MKNSFENSLSNLEIAMSVSSYSSNICENQTQSSFDEIEDRINVVVPYLVVLGTDLQKQK